MNTIGIVYKIQLINDENDKTCYIDKTRNVVSSMTYHKKEYNKQIDTPFYNFIREKGGMNMFSCNILFESSNISLIELENKMKEFEENYKHTLISNKQRQRVPNKDYIKINTDADGTDWASKYKQYCKKYDKQYKITNNDRLKTRITCDCGGVYTRSNPTTHLSTDIHLRYLIRLKEEEEELESD